VSVNGHHPLACRIDDCQTWRQRLGDCDTMISGHNSRSVSQKTPPMPYPIVLWLEVATVICRVLPSPSRNTIMPLKCCAVCARELTTLTGIKQHRQCCSNYRGYIATLQSLKKWVAEAMLDAREGTNVTSHHQRGEPETTQTDDTVSLVIFPSPT
jgi:hypothetical protein